MTKKELIKIANELDRSGSHKAADYYDNNLAKFAQSTSIVGDQDFGFSSSVTSPYAYGNAGLSKNNAVSFTKYNTTNATLGIPFSFPASVDPSALGREPSPPSPQFQAIMAQIPSTIPSVATGSTGSGHWEGPLINNPDEACFMVGYKFLPLYTNWLAGQQTLFQSFIVQNGPGETSIAAGGDQDGQETLAAAISMLTDITTWLQCVVDDYTPCTPSNFGTPNNPQCYLGEFPGSSPPTWSDFLNDILNGGSIGAAQPGTFGDPISTALQSYGGPFAGVPKPSLKQFGTCMATCLCAEALVNPTSGAGGSGAGCDPITNPNCWPACDPAANPNCQGAPQSGQGGCNPATNPQGCLNSCSPLSDIVEGVESLPATKACAIGCALLLVLEELAVLADDVIKWLGSFLGGLFGSSPPRKPCRSNFNVFEGDFANKLGLVYTELMQQAGDLTAQWTSFANIITQFGLINQVLQGELNALTGIQNTQSHGAGSPLQGASSYVPTNSNYAGGSADNPQCTQNVNQIMHLYANFICLNYSDADGSQDQADRFSACAQPQGGAPQYVLDNWNQVQTCKGSANGSACDIKNQLWKSFNFADFSIAPVSNTSTPVSSTFGG